MAQLNFHISSKKSDFNAPIIAKLNEAYKIWHSFLIHLPKISRFTLGAKIDNLFTDCLELALLAGNSPKDKKIEVIEKLSAKFDILKYFIKVLWEIKEIDAKKLALISAPLAETGKMLGGWIKFFNNKQTPPEISGGE